jgi:hypothetical protein
MIGVLAGIVFIGSVGEFLMRGAGRARGKGAGGVFFAGLALFLIGAIGVLFAQIIKAAISRQREFLADASSVQFTRNPDGIAGALDQIGLATARVGNRYAQDMSHMYFGEAASALFDTHPPLAERIRRANPRFQAHEYRKTRAPALPGAEEAAAAAAAPAGQGGRTGMRAGDQAHAWGRSAGAAVALVGALDAANLTAAQRLVRTLPGGLQAQLADPQGARAAVVALMLAPRDEVMQAQLAALRAAGAGTLAEAARALAPEAAGLAPALRLPAVDLALPSLKAGPAQAKRELIAALEAVIRADRRVSLHEFCVLELVKSQLAPAPRAAAQRAALGALAAQAATLLALLAHAGRRPDADAAAVRQAFDAGAKEMGLGALAAPDRERLTLEAAAQALDALRGLAPLQQALLVKGLFAAATADGTIRVSEAELLRLVGAVLDCPLPPLLAEATLAS